MRRVYDLAVIVIIGVILAEFIKGFYTPGTGTIAAFGGGSGVIVSGVANIWKTSVNAMLGNPAGVGPNNPGSQATPKPGTIPAKPSPSKPSPPSFPTPTSCCCGFEPFCIFHSPACCTIP